MDHLSATKFIALLSLRVDLGRPRRIPDPLPKAKAIEDALRGGVRRVHVVSYKAPEGILSEVFTNEGTGTLIITDINPLTPAEQSSGGV